MKKILIFLALLSSLTILSAQEETIEESDTSHEFTKAEGFIDFIHSLDFVLQTEPGVYINTADRHHSAPSPIIYPLTIGILWPNYTKLAIQPTISFFATDYLWYDDMALPAEIENRTVTGLNFMITLPVVISMYFKNSRIQILPGISILTRFGFLSAGVSKDDYGYSGTAGSDADLINEWFWKDMHFLYLGGGFAWMFNINGNVKAGPVANMMIPLSVVKGDKLLGSIFSAGLKISL